MKVMVVMFGAAADRSGVRQATVEVGEGATVEDVWDAVASSHPGVEPMRGILAFAVNGEYADVTQGVSEGDEVAMLPPVSGG